MKTSLNSCLLSVKPHRAVRQQRPVGSNMMDSRNEVCRHNIYVGFVVLQKSDFTVLVAVLAKNWPDVHL